MEMPRMAQSTFEGQAAKINKKKRKNGEGQEDDDAAPVASGSRLADSDGEDAEILTSPPKKPRKAKQYAPRVKSGPWAILIGLASFGVGVWKSEAEIVERADPFYQDEGQSLKDSSTGGGAGAKFYTGWSSVSRTLA